MTEQEQKELNDLLLNAAWNGDLKAVKELLERGADIEVKDIDDWNALHWAAVKGHLEVVKELIERGANLEAKEHEGHTALYLVSITDQLVVVKELLEAGAEPDLETLSKYTKEVLEVKRKTSVDVWSDILFCIIKEQDKYSKEDFKKYVLEFLAKTKTEIPENIYIILNTLI